MRGQGDDPSQHDVPRRHYRVEGCTTCADDMEGRKLMPPHEASERCESGKRNHCSCDACF